jgi:hypothetical protein
MIWCCASLGYETRAAGNAAAAVASVRRASLVVLVALALVILTAGCRPQEEQEQTIAAAGAIAACNTKGDEATARLLEGIDGTVLALGDNAYPDGSAEDFQECYDPSWGQFKDRTRPVPGNREYNTRGARAYFEYFGEAAGDPEKGYYSYNLGSWHVVALNSNCKHIGGCTRQSAQVQWLRDDLAANWDKHCTLAYIHDPLFSSGRRGKSPEVKSIWQVLYEAGADVVLSADDRNYERFAPQDPDGKADSERGIRQFVVGTGGGANHYPILDSTANSEVHNDDTYGVLKLTLRPEGYKWRFVPVEGAQFTDSGSARCH